MTNSADPLRPSGAQSPHSDYEALRDQQHICTKLADIFVNQMGVVSKISLDVDPHTGMKEFRFELNRNSPILTQLKEQEIRGIPVRFVFDD